MKLVTQFTLGMSHCIVFIKFIKLFDMSKLNHWWCFRLVPLNLIKDMGLKFFLVLDLLLELYIYSLVYP